MLLFDRRQSLAVETIFGLVEVRDHLLVLGLDHRRLVKCHRFLLRTKVHTSFAVIVIQVRIRWVQRRALIVLHPLNCHVVAAVNDFVVERRRSIPLVSGHVDRELVQSPLFIDGSFLVKGVLMH